MKVEPLHTLFTPEKYKNIKNPIFNILIQACRRAQELKNAKKLAIFTFCHIVSGNWVLRAKKSGSSYYNTVQKIQKIQFLYQYPVSVSPCFLSFSVGESLRVCIFRAKGSSLRMTKPQKRIPIKRVPIKKPRDNKTTETIYPILNS